MGSHREFESNAVPEQMAAMQKLGFETRNTEDPRYAEWAGYGLNITLPSAMKLTDQEALKAVVGAAVKTGREQMQADLRQLLGFGGGR